VLGPIALLLALSSVRNGRPSWSRLLAGGDPGSGPVDVLIGIDGSPESAAAAAAALELLGDHVGRLALVAVTAIDDSLGGREEQTRLQAELERQAQALQTAQGGGRQSGRPGQTVKPALVMRSGQPAAVLDQMALEDGYGLVVVGARGAGLSTVLLGSVATRLAAQASVPVLVVGARAGQDTGSPLAGLVDQADPRRP
jgi:nucleotide-binding universal stress UspA family protein